MSTLFVILVIIAAVALGFIVLIQNPKGGGVSGSLGGFSNQLIGVKQSTDVMEKGTWLFAAVVGILCIVSPAFISKTSSGSAENEKLRKGISTKQNAVAPTTQDTTGKMPGAAQTPKP